MSTAVAEYIGADLKAQLHRLHELWSSLALRHVALGGACGCGAGGVSLRLEDFELDIVDYFHDTAARSDDPEVAAWGHAAQQAVAASGEVMRMRQLFEVLDGPRTPQPVLRWLLPRLERTLGSYAALHGQG